MSAQSDFEVAIIGGGIVGLVLAIGLSKRNIKVTIYEQASGFREVGAGVAFTANAIRCMGLVDPSIVAAVRAVATPNGDPDNPSGYLQYIDGFSYDPKDPAGTEGKLLYRLDAGYRGFEGCHRAHLLAELVGSIDEGMVQFGKRLDKYVNRGNGAKVLLKFHDGTTAEADAVIGCDGIKSQVRKVMHGADNPVSYPHFSHKVAFRALIDMKKAEEAIGSHKARTQHMHTGPGAHLLHFPVAGQTVMNVVAFKNEPEPWTSESMTAPATRDEVAATFAGWGPTVTAVVGLLPEKLDKWGIFDTYDHLVPKYNSGRVCLAGDAAHAAAPHHGAGAGIGIEDALALCTLMELAINTSAKSAGVISRADAVEKAFAVYDAVRKERCQWLVKSSHEVCDIYEWNHPETGTDWEKCLNQVRERSHKLWYFDIIEMLVELRARFYELIVPHPVKKGQANGTSPMAVKTIAAEGVVTA